MAWIFIIVLIFIIRGNYLAVFVVEGSWWRWHLRTPISKHQQRNWTTFRSITAFSQDLWAWLLKDWLICQRTHYYKGHSFACIFSPVFRRGCYLSLIKIETLTKKRAAEEYITKFLALSFPGVFLEHISSNIVILKVCIDGREELIRKIN